MSKNMHTNVYACVVLFYSISVFEWKIYDCVCIFIPTTRYFCDMFRRSEIMLTIATSLNMKYSIQNRRKKKIVAQNPKKRRKNLITLPLCPNNKAKTKRTNEWTNVQDSQCKRCCLSLYYFFFHCYRCYCCCCFVGRVSGVAVQRTYCIASASYVDMCSSHSVSMFVALSVCMSVLYLLCRPCMCMFLCVNYYRCIKV